MLIENNRKLFKQSYPPLNMEKQEFATKEELTEFSEKLDESMRQIQGIKSTIEILQDKEAMKDIMESEKLEEEGFEPVKINI